MVTFFAYSDVGNMQTKHGDGLDCVKMWYASPLKMFSLILNRESNKTAYSPKAG